MSSWHERELVPQHLCEPSHASYQSFESSPFLSSPRLSQLDIPFPFKAPASDTTSLSLKKRHHAEHSKRSGAGVKTAVTTREHGESDWTSVTKSRFSRSQSLPYLGSRSLSGPDGPLFTPTRVIGGNLPAGEILRRWTLSSKADSTRGLSTLSPIFKHHPAPTTKRLHASPAIITLRRASNKPVRSTSITFFPPPDFSRSKTSLILSFLSSITGADTQQSGHTGQVDHPDVEQGLPVQNVLGKKIGDSKNEVASPTVTRVTFEPDVSWSAAGSEPFRPRRCSTRYVTRSSVYEVIWDENDSPSTESGAPSRQGGAVNSVERRQSAAVAQLETQLSRADAQSRRASCSYYQEGEQVIDMSSSRRWSFRTALNSSLSRLTNEAALRSLPRSKASKHGQSSISSISAGRPVHHIVDDVDDKVSSSPTEIFPPVDASSLSVGHNKSKSVSSQTTENETTWCNPQGEGFYTNRHVDGKRDKNKQEGGQRSARHMESTTRSKCIQSLNDDRIPLLHEFRWDEAGAQ